MLLLPPSVADFVPAGDPAHLIRDLVSEDLDLSAIMSAYPEVKGYPPGHAAMMVAASGAPCAYSSSMEVAGCPVAAQTARGATRRPGWHTQLTVTH